MAAVLVIEVKGTSTKEIEKNLIAIDSYMNTQQILYLVSDIRNKSNTRIYYTKNNVVIANLRKIITDLRTDKNMTIVIKSMYYHGSLNKV